MKQQFFILFMIITLELKKPKFHYLANTTAFQYMMKNSRGSINFKAKE